MNLVEYFILNVNKGYIKLTDPGYYIHDFWTAKGIASITVDIDKSGFAIKNTGVTVVLKNYTENGYNPDEISIRYHGASFMEAGALMSALEGFIDLAIKCAEHDKKDSAYWKEKIKEMKDILTELKTNEELFIKVFSTIYDAFKIIQEDIKMTEKSYRKDKELWNKLQLEKLASRYESSTMVTPASVYLREGGHLEEERAELIESVINGGELIKVLRLEETSQSYKVAKIYRYHSQYYCVVERAFDNNQGLNIDEEVLYKILNPEILE